MLDGIELGTIWIPLEGIKLEELVLISSEDAYLIHRMLRSIAGECPLVYNLELKLAAIFDAISITEIVGNKSASEKFHYLRTMGKYYRHFKGNIYRLLHEARHSETQEIMVVYQAMYGNNDIWVRPKAMFDEEITRDGMTFRRFTRISEEEALAEYNTPAFSDRCLS